jgi:hypothetical protein
MLDAFYHHVGSHRGMRYLHWNMRDINYGFAAIEHRHRVLKGTPVIIEDDKKIDLARILIDIYGVGYIGHPRLENLLVKNSIKPRDFLTGPQEAEAFEKRNFVGLHQSTLRKVDVLANLAERVHTRQLRTNTTWWEMHGGRIGAVTRYREQDGRFSCKFGHLYRARDRDPQFEVTPPVERLRDLRAPAKERANENQGRMLRNRAGRLWPLSCRRQRR